MATDTIVQKIAIDGGKEIEDALKRVGKAGQQAFDSIAEAGKAASAPFGALEAAAKRLGISVEEMQGRMAQARSAVAGVGQAATQAAAPIASMGDRLAGLASAARAAARTLLVLAPALAGAGLSKLATGAADANTEFNDLAAKSGLTRERFVAMAKAGAAVGLSAKEMASSLTAVGTILGKQAQTTKQAEDTQSKFREQIAQSQSKADDLVGSFDKLNAAQDQLSTQLARGAISAEDYLRQQAQIAAESLRVSAAISDQDAQTRKLQRAQQLANIEAINGQTTLQRLGVTALDASGKLKQGDAALAEIAGAFDRAGTAAEKDKLAFDLIAAGIDQRLLPSLRQGAAGFASLQARASQIKLPISDADARTLENLSIASSQAGLAFAELKTAIGAAIAPAFVTFFEQMRDVLVAIRPGLAEFARVTMDVLGPALGAIGTAVATVVVPAFRALGSLLSAVASGINAAFGTNVTALQVFAGLVGGLLVAFGGLPVAIGAAVTAVGFLIEQINALGGVGKIWDSLVAGVQSMWDRIASLWQAGVDKVKALLQPLIDLWNKLTGAAQAAGAAQAVAGGGGGRGFAGGGYVRGPGTATSDSIPARLSAGEFVHKVRAVRAYGQDFMHALNQLRIDPAVVRALMANGVASIMPAPVQSLRFAEGGMVPELARVTSSMRPITLNIGGEQIAGLLAPDDVAERITRFAVRKQVASGGRKPGYYGGGR